MTAIAVLATLSAAQVNPNEYAGLVWRNIGPFRAGRISAASGVIGRPGVFYVGTPQGGIWKTVSGGMTWFPIFDQITSVNSIGAIAVAPSNSNIVYAGTGDAVDHEALSGEGGDGMYKSVDAGKTWTHIGLEGSYKIPSIIVDPKDPNVVLVAAMSGLKGTQRGVFRSDDGGAHWTNVLNVDDVTGARNLSAPFDMPNVVFATTIADGAESLPGGRAVGRGGAGPSRTKLFRSLDEGKTWTEVTNNPLKNGRIAVTVAMKSNGQRVYLIGSGGLYRSDDQGANWSKTITDYRIVGGQYICEVYTDPQNPDTVYVMNTSTYKSTDGGKTFDGWKGSPGGDDQHYLWIDPTDPDRILLASDEGATLSYDGGGTWSSWYNQPTAQIYHIGISNKYPYWVYGTQQDPCGFGTASRGDYGEITPFDWSPLPIYEEGYVVVDPLDANIVYGGGPDSGILKVWLNNNQWENVGPNIGAPRNVIGTTYRKTTDQPLVFSPQDPHTLYLGTQYVTATSDGGKHWRNLGDKDLAARGAGGGGGATGGLDTIAPSTVAAGEIWTGSNNGLIHLTRDGGNTWNDVSPPELEATSNVSILEASHFDPAEAYAAVNSSKPGDFIPTIYRTRDFGAHWTLITNGLPTGQLSGSFVRVVREDTKKRGLLFAGTESSVYVSFDDGDHWQSLALNLPLTSYRDLLVHDNDLVAATFGRSLWVLDDISALRQITPQLSSQAAYLFKPADAVRTRKNLNRDTPLPPEIPHALNPPTGAIFYYYLGSRPSGDIKLQIYDAQNNLVRTLSSAPIPFVPGTPAPNVPNAWLQHPESMSTEVGTNRYTWDLHYDHPPSFVQNYSNEKFDAIYHDTPYDPQGPLVLPGTYTAKLAVNGTTYTQTFKVTEDPRVPSTQATQADLVAMHDLQMKVYNDMFETWNGYQAVTDMRNKIKQLAAGQMPTAAASALTAFDAKLALLQDTPAVAGAGGGGRGGGGGAQNPAGFGRLNIQFGGDGQSGYINVFGYAADIAPTPAERRAYQISCTQLNGAVDRWKAVNTTDLPALNSVLSANQLPPLQAASALQPQACGPEISIAPSGAPSGAAAVAPTRPAQTTPAAKPRG